MSRIARQVAGSAQRLSTPARSTSGSAFTAGMVFPISDRNPDLAEFSRRVTSPIAMSSSLAAMSARNAACTASSGRPSPSQPEMAAAVCGRTRDTAGSDTACEITV